MKKRRNREPVTKAMLADEVQFFENTFNCSLNIIKEENSDYQLWCEGEMVMAGTRKEILQFLRHYIVMDDYLTTVQNNR